MPALILLTKLVLAAVWVAFASGALAILPAPFARIAIVLGVVLLLVHAGEYAFVRYRCQLNDPSRLSLPGTLLFGFAHWLPLLKRR